MHARAHKLLRPLFNLLYTDAFACGRLAGEWLFPGRPFTVLNNATNTDKYKFNESERLRIRNKYDLEGKIAVGHVAHFTEQKNHEFLIEVFTELLKCDSRYKLFLIGGGILQKQTEEQVKALGIEDAIIFVGTTLEIPAYLSAMDLMVLPSLWEGLPNVVIEWQVSGLPILVSNTVTADCKLTESVNFIPLEKETWVDSILQTDISGNRTALSERNIKQIASAGFSIGEQAARLKQYYLDRLKQ